MKDVAALAQVSVGTISNVLNKPELVAPATRQRVTEAIAKLGWVRNEPARHLRAGHSALIGVVVMDFVNPFFSDFSRGVEDVATAAGFSVLISDSANDSARERVALQLLQQLRVQGVVLAPLIYGPGDGLTRTLGMPVVLANRFTNADDSCTVSIDNFAGGRLAVGHLLERGHRRIAAVGGRADMPQVRERRAGADSAVSSGNSEASMVTVSTERLDIDAGRVAAATILALPHDERPTGIFAINDLVAIGLLQGLVANGVDVPAQIALIGYDDIDFAAAATVPLSSIRQPRRELGRAACELLLAEITGSEADAHRHVQQRFTPELVVRASSLAHRQEG